MVLSLSDLLENHENKAKRIKPFPYNLTLLQNKSSRIFIGIQKYLASNKVKFIMPGIHSKITRYAKNAGKYSV